MTLREAIAARRGYYLAAVTILLVDQATKLLAQAYLAGRDPVVVVPGAFNLWYSRNPGGLFGFFGSLPDPWRSLLLTGVPLIAVTIIAVFLAKTDEPDRGTLFGLALILGGASGNLIDRVIRGEVIDFLDVYVSSQRLADWLIQKFGTAHWPTFNVADSAIVVGVGLLLLDIVRPRAGNAPAG